MEDGTTVSDFDEVEIRQQRSVNLTLAPLTHAGVKVNLLDTPGYADFTGDLRAGLRAADAALFAVSATEGVDGLTRMLWEECAAVGMPRAVVITKIDHQRADFEQALAACRAAFGESVAPLYFPVTGAKGDLTGLIGLLSGRLFDYSGGERAERDPDPADTARVEELRGSLIEGIIQESEDESLMDAYLSGEEIDPKSLIEDLETAVARGSFYPVLAASSPHGIGLEELLEVVTQAFPPPQEHPLPAVTTLDGKPVTGIECDPDGPLLAEVVKTTSDPYVGRISLVRVFSGTLRPDVVVHVSGHGLADRGHADHDNDERVGALTSPLGKQQRPVASCPAGDICAVAKLTSAETGDTLSSKERPLLMDPWAVPEPLLPVAITAKSKADEDKMSQALARLVAEDPTLRMEMNAETRQLVLWCMGEAHADLLLDRLSSRYGVAVETTELRVPLRETVAGKAQGLGRNVKQTGGHGEFGICHIEVEPLPSGSGLEFVDKIVGGVVPRQFIPSVEKGVRAQMEQGVAAGLPDGGRPGHPVRRQGALGGLVRHGLPEGRPGGAEGRRQQGQSAAAGAGGRAVGAGRRRVRRRGHVRPVVAAGQGARHRAGRGRADPGQGRGAGAGADPLRHRPALDVARHRLVQPVLPALRATALAPGRQAGHRRLTGPGQPAAGQLAAIRSLVCDSSWGSTRVPPTTGMKLVSPPHRGTMCWCRWAAMPAPATAPMFMPTLNPCAPVAARRAVIARLV